MPPTPLLTPPTPTRSDAAAAAVGYAIGFAIDIFLFPAGVPPGTTAGVFAVAAVGAKNTAESIISSNKQRAQAQEELAQKESQAKRNALLEWDRLSKKYEAMVKYFDLKHAQDFVKRIELEHEIWGAGILLNEEFEKSIDEMFEEYRTSPPPGLNKPFLPKTSLK